MKDPKEKRINELINKSGKKNTARDVQALHKELKNPEINAKNKLGANKDSLIEKVKSEDSKIELENLHTLIAQKNSRIDFLEHELSSSKALVMNNKAVINEITSSFSWRISKPLRLIKNNKLREKILLNRNIKLVDGCDLFDADFYLGNNSDVRESGVNPLKHFVQFGGFEGRQASLNFDTAYYNSQNPDVIASGLNPLVHYILFGKHEGRKAVSEKTAIKHDLHATPTTDKKISKHIVSKFVEKLIHRFDLNTEIKLIKESGLFDVKYYLANNADVKNEGINPIQHYCTNGWSEGRNPSSKFDTKNYLAANNDVKKSGINPLFHYIKYGKTEGRQLEIKYVPELELQSTFETQDTSTIDLTQLPVKTIAFYLPQFHPIPENDNWWGKGFTEWTNVTRAKPIFDGHYQPHLPHELGFYDLRIPEIMEQQIEMAKAFGIHGFCFYYYWFDGKRLLEKPLDMFLEHPEWDLNFCICWANENWTRRWDGLDSQVLIGQNHSSEDDIEFIKDIVKYVNDERYIHIDGRPLIVIYRPQLFPNIKESVKRWRKYFKETHNKDLFFAMVQSFGNFGNPAEFGFDAAIEFPPLNISPTNITNTIDATDFAGNIYDTSSIIEDVKNKLKKVDYELFRGVMLNWDNTSRIGKSAHIFLNNTPQTYETWLSEAINDTIVNKYDDSRKLVFINAWNEWAEGTHLEPDQKYGYAYLNATKRSLINAKDNTKNIENSGNVLFVSHDAALAGAQLVLLDIVKWLFHHTSVKIKILFLQNGELISNFAKYGATHIIDSFNNAALKEEISDFIDGKEDLFYANSVASGRVLKTLHEFNVPILMHVHELQKSIEVYAKDYMPDILNYTNHYIACSQAVLQNLTLNYGVSTKIISQVHAFVKSELEKPVSESHKTFLKQKLGLPVDKKIVYGVGLGLFWRKGADLFIDVYLQLKKRFNTNDILFLWVGDFSSNVSDSNYGLWNDHLLRIKKLGFENDIIFLGKKNNVREYLATGELFLLPSREDPFPLVCLEAADNYLPIVCFDEAGGMPELVQDDAGYVVPFENTVEMASKVYHLLNNKKDKILRGEVAHQRFVENYTVTASMHKILGAVRNVGNINPLVSIIVPNYNYSRYLQKRLDSVYNQTFQDFEVIILDDCSTDNSMDIIDSYRTKASTQVVVNEVNSGSVFNQWKKGVELAKGKYIWIAEADDYCENTFLEKLLPAFINKDVNLTYCNSNAVDEVGKVDNNFYNKVGYYNGLGYEPNRWESDYTNNGIDEIKNVLAIKNTIPNCSAVIFRKDVFLQSNFSIIEKLKCSHDWLTYITLIKDGDIHYSSLALNYHRRHDKSVIAINAVDYKKTISEYNLSHKYILENYNIADYIKQKMYNLIFNDLRNNWGKISLDSIKQHYPIYEKTQCIPETDYKYDNVGYCPICNSKTVFYSNEDWLRDNYRCMKCNSIPRERAIFHVFNQYFPDWKSKKIHESSPSNNYFSNAVEQYSYSQYFANHETGKIINGTRNENLEKLTFPDGSFDYFITLDVLEHVFNPELAIREMLRTIVNGGSAIFTVPVQKNLKKSVQRATLLDDNSINYLLPEEYHGNPVADGRALVTWDYGEDFESLVQGWIGNDFEVNRIDVSNEKRGIIGEYIDVFFIKKNINNLIRFNHLSDDEWYNKILDSLATNKLDGLKVGFPNSTVQANLTGRNGERALFQAFNFYKRVNHYANLYLEGNSENMTICDFACGWGRITRFFLRDVPANNITGMDCVPDFIETCKNNIPDIDFVLIPDTPPYDIDKKFDLICAYSLFSHLNEDSAKAVLLEIHKMLNIGGILVITSRGLQFINYCKYLQENNENVINTKYARRLSTYFTPNDEAKLKYKKGEFQFYSYPKSGKLNRELYGEAAIPIQWFQANMADNFEIAGFELENMEEDLDQTIIILKKIN